MQTCEKLRNLENKLSLSHVTSFLLKWGIFLVYSFMKNKNSYELRICVVHIGNDDF